MTRFSRFLTLSVLAGLLAAGLAPTASGQTPNATIENKSGETALESSYSGGLLAPGKFGDLTNYSAPNDSIPASGAGTRMMWYPEKAAFRAGRVGDVKDGTQWDASQVGFYSVAFGVDTKASGFAAMSMGVETTASGRDATAMGSFTTASGRDATAMGFVTTAATSQSLSIGTYNSANTSDDNTLFVAGNGSGSDSRSDALVLKKDGDFGLSTSSPVAHLHVQESVKETGATNLGRHAGVVENTSTDDGADVFALKTALDNPRGVTNFISFLDADEQVGTIQGNGNGGIEITGNGADFAEELPVAEGKRAPEPAEIVGVRGGEVSLQTGGAGRVMVASRAPIMTGNAEPGSETDAARRVKVAFVGQVPVKTRGSVDTGDLIVASGQDDGTARAVSPENYRRSKHGPIAGQAWSAKTTEGVGEVTVAVGLGSTGPLAQQLEEERERIDRLEERLAALEEGRASSLPAGLVGPWALALLLGLGGLAAGLLWRRRGSAR